VSLFGSWNWYLPDGVAKLLRVQPSHPLAEKAGPTEELVPAG
jgi:RND superfamily putative drug exporter